MVTRRYRNKKNYSKKKRYSSKNKYFSKKRKQSKKNKRGGFGKGSCPFITPPPAWNANGYSYFFPLSKNGVSPGGVPVFPGDSKLSRQNGGNILSRITPQFMLNTSRVATTGIGNIVNRYKGKHLDPSPLPMYNQLKSTTLHKKGL